MILFYPTSDRRGKCLCATCSSIRLSPILDREHMNHGANAPKADPPIPNSKAMHAGEFSFERLDVALTSCGEARKRRQDAHRRIAI